MMNKFIILLLLLLNFSAFASDSLFLKPIYGEKFLREVQASTAEYSGVSHNCTNVGFLRPVAKKMVSSQCLTLGSSIHYSSFDLHFYECKNYLKAKPTGSQCRSTGMTKKGKVFSNFRVEMQQSHHSVMRWNDTTARGKYTVVGVFEENSLASTTKLPLEIELQKKSNFVSTKSNKINMRTGPGFHYPVKWVYTHKNLPLKVMEEFETWKKVCDIDEDCGWIKNNLLSNKRYAMIKEDTLGYKKQNFDSKIIMKIDKLVIMKVEKCDKEWCLLSASKRRAWVQKEYIYGVD